MKNINDLLKNLLSCDIITEKSLEGRMIRESIKRSIYDALNYDIFRRDEFTVSENEDVNDTYFIRIESEYGYYEISFIKGKEDVFISCSPGEIFNDFKGYLKLENIPQNVCSDIKIWLDRIKEEILNPVIERYLDETVRAFMEDMNSNLDEMKDSQFTREEKQDLLERLEKLEKIVNNNIGDDSQYELIKEIQKMQQEIAFLKEMLGSSSKKKWLKNFMLKICAWGKDPQNQEILKMGMETVKTISQIDLK